ACHRVQAKKPLDSALLIGDERLTVSQIMKHVGFSHERPADIETRMGLAFLSTCETVRGDKNAPDRAMHLAATLLFA
ncbi:hypothetical protein B0H13DRAFT_1583389, partial [Mycena leptocephala]